MATENVEPPVDSEDVIETMYEGKEILPFFFTKERQNDPNEAEVWTCKESSCKKSFKVSFFSLIKIFFLYEKYNRDHFNWTVSSKIRKAIHIQQKNPLLQANFDFEVRIWNSGHSGTFFGRRNLVHCPSTIIWGHPLEEEQTWTIFRVESYDGGRELSQALRKPPTLRRNNNFKSKKKPSLLIRTWFRSVRIKIRWLIFASRWGVFFPVNFIYIMKVRCRRMLWGVTYVHYKRVHVLLESQPL